MHVLTAPICFHCFTTSRYIHSTHIIVFITILADEGVIFGARLRCPLVVAVYAQLDTSFACRVQRRSVVSPVDVVFVDGTSQ